MTPEAGKSKIKEAAPGKVLLLCHPVEDQEKREQGKGGEKLFREHLCSSPMT